MNLGAAPGLCATCQWVRVITTRTGSTFLNCRRSEIDPRFARYPVLPVRSCDGYTRSDPPPDALPRS